jgi:hypothetical protein
METKQYPTQLAYEYAIVEKKNAQARKNLQGLTIEHFRKLRNGYEIK